VEIIPQNKSIIPNYRDNKGKTKVNRTLKFRERFLSSTTKWQFRRCWLRHFHLLTSRLGERGSTRRLADYSSLQPRRTRERERERERERTVFAVQTAAHDGGHDAVLRWVEAERRERQGRGSRGRVNGEGDGVFCVLSCH